MTINAKERPLNVSNVDQGMTKMTKSVCLRLMCTINFFCAELVLGLVVGASSQTSFLFPPDFNHLSLKEMSHAQLGESCGICWIQFIFLWPTEPL